MLKPRVSSCFNPSCESQFLRFGDGKLFVEPARELEKDHARRVVWLCAKCCHDHTLRYDWEQREFVLAGHRGHGRRIA